MDLMDKFKAVEVETDRRITRADKAFCEKHQAAYETALAEFKELSFFWADMVKEQKELLGEESNYRNEIYLSASSGVNIKEDRIRNNIEEMHSTFIDTLVTHFNSAYKVSVSSYDVKRLILPEKPDYHDSDTRKKAYHQQLGTMTVRYQDVVDQIVLRLGGRSFEEQATYEIKSGCSSAVWDSYEKTALFERKKNAISFYHNFCSYDEIWGRWSLYNGTQKILYGLAHFETGAAGIYPWPIDRLLSGRHEGAEQIVLGGCEKASKLRLYKNGRIDITFASSDYAETFIKDYLGETYADAA